MSLMGKMAKICILNLLLCNYGNSESMKKKKNQNEYVKNTT